MEEAKSASLVFIWVFSVQVELEFGNVVFPEGRKTGAARYKPSEQGKNQQQTQPPHRTRLVSNTDYIGGRRAFTTVPSLLPKIPAQ